MEYVIKMITDDHDTGNLIRSFLKMEV